MMTNKMQLFWFIYLFLISSTCFGRCRLPSSGALDSIYSIWYCPLVLPLAGVMDAIPSPGGGRQHRVFIISTSCNTQSIAPEDGQNNCPKHVELTGIINNPLLLHLVGCLCYLY